MYCTTMEWTIEKKCTVFNWNRLYYKTLNVLYYAGMDYTTKHSMYCTTLELTIQKELNVLK